MAPTNLRSCVQCIYERVLYDQADPVVHTIHNEVSDCVYHASHSRRQTHRRNRPGERTTTLIITVMLQQPSTKAFLHLLVQLDQMGWIRMILTHFRLAQIWVITAPLALIPTGKKCAAVPPPRPSPARTSTNHL